MKEGLPDIESALPQLIFDDLQPGSLRSVLEELSRVASVVRDRLSMDSWRTLVRIASFTLNCPSEQLHGGLCLRNPVIVH